MVTEQERAYFEQFSGISDDELHPKYVRGAYDDKLYQRIDGKWVVVEESVDPDAAHS